MIASPKDDDDDVDHIMDIIIDMICHTMLIDVSSSTTTTTIKMIKHLDKHVRL